MTLPTHDEVIAWIDERVAWLDKSIAGYIEDTRSWRVEYMKDYRASLLANRDVLGRHKPKPACLECALWQFDKEGNIVNCPTYLDILQRIAEVM